MSKALRLGVFIVVTLALFAAGVFWIGSKRFLFEHTYRLNADFKNVAGLNDGAEVRVGGIHQGTVKRIDLPRNPTDKVRVEMDLKGGTREVVRKDSLASIRSEGLVGDKYVEITFGSDQSQKVDEGDTIATEPPLEIADLIKKTNAMLDSANGAVQEVGATAGNLKEISGKINQGTGTMGAFINDKSVYQHVNQAATEMQEDMQALKHNFLLRGFFHKRGYENAEDLTRNRIVRLPAQASSRKFDFDADKVFDKPDSAKLKKSKGLTEAGKFLEQNPFGLAVVAGYTNVKGDSEKNHVLTEARAVVVRDYLIKNFKIDDQRVKTMGLGENAESDKGGVEILVYPTAVSAPAPTKETRK
jgi:phospholipid/cholesterol/gamma-HCH transport system substrate-binding protein